MSVLGQVGHNSAWGLHLRRMPTEVAEVDRATWPAELADALEKAQSIAWRMESSTGDDSEVMELYGRLEAARVEVRSLHLCRFGGLRRQLDPNCIEPLHSTRDEQR